MKKAAIKLAKGDRYDLQSLAFEGWRNPEGAGKKKRVARVTKVIPGKMSNSGSIHDGSAGNSGLAATR